MATVPFHDFDEAHRAEKAKRMKEYFSFLVPLSGSPQDRTHELKVPLKENHSLFLYYHPERPPLVYWLMIVSTSIFGKSELAYRLPSLLMAIATIVTLVTAAIFTTKLNFSALIISLVAFLASSDLWLSGQYAQLDTTLTFFLFLSLSSLILYIEKRKNSLLLISGISFSLAVLSKGQPAAIMILPLLTLFLLKKLTMREIIRFFLYSSMILLPWFILLAIYFDLGNFIKIFANFTVYSAAIEYSHLKAPIYWYVRWWWDFLRPGWAIFLALLIYDIINHQLNFKKWALLSYIVGGLLFFSVAVNKIWWYVLPLVPAIAYYIYISVSDYLSKDRDKLINLSAVILLASLPIFLADLNRVTLIYGFLITLMCLWLISLPPLKLLSKFREVILGLAIILSLSLFLLHFPKIEPYHQNTKLVAEVFSGLPGRKCLLTYDMPPETALFYSNAGEIILLLQDRKLLPNCENYLITPAEIQNIDLSYSYKGKTYNLKEAQIIFQKGTMKLIHLAPSN